MCGKWKAFGVETLQGVDREHMSAGPAASQLAIYASGLSPRTKTHQTETASAADDCSNTGRNKQATVTHSDRTSPRDKIHNVAIKPLRM